MEDGSQNAKGDDEEHAENGGNHSARVGVQQRAQKRARNRCTGIKVLDEYVGLVSRHHVTEHTAPHTCDDPQKNAHEKVGGFGGAVTDVHAHHGEDTQSDGVSDQQQCGVKLWLFMDQKMLNSGEKNENGNRSIWYDFQLQST